MQLRNLKISVRLAIAFSFVLALTALMAAIGIWRLQEVNSATADMEEAVIKERLSHMWYLGNIANAIRTTARLKVTEPEDIKFYQAEMAAQSNEISKIQQELEPLIISEGGKRLLAKVAEQRNTYMDIRNDILKMKEQGYGADQAQIRQLIVSRMDPAMHAYNASVQEVVEYQKVVFEQAKTRVDELYASGRNLLLMLGLLAIAIGAVMAWALSRSIIKPLNYAVSVARTVAGGDLSTRIEVSSKDETGQLLQSLKDMNTSLADIVGQVRTGTQTIATASGQIAAGNQDLSSRTEQQASSLEETASSMEELTSTVRQNADNARQANQLAIVASDVASKGGEAVSRVIGTMDEINESAKKIVDIIAVIDGIAFQTNILALNAAVEAARAGEQGRGFAVVATEVRSLAQRSASAAKEIKELISTSVEKVGTGSKLVAEAGSTMEEVVGSVSRVTDIMGEITAASQEQSTGIEQVNQAITQMDQVTQQNAALVEEAAAAAQSLQDQAAVLARLVNTFKLDRNATPDVAPHTQRVNTSASTPVLSSNARQANMPSSPARVAQPALAVKRRDAKASSPQTDEWEEF